MLSEASTPRSRSSAAWRDEGGYTLIELLVAMLLGLIVLGATFGILDVALRQTSRVSDRVSANQRGRVAMENIMLALHSSCIAPNITPVEPGSSENELRIISERGSAPSFASVTLHKIQLKEGKLIDTSYLSTSAKPPPEWEFSPTAHSTTTLLTGVSATNLFQYFSYSGSTISETALAVPLTSAAANETAKIAVKFTVAPESGNKSGPAGDRPIELTDAAVLRFSPSSTTGTNYPCT